MASRGVFHRGKEEDLSGVIDDDGTTFRILVSEQVYLSIRPLRGLDSRIGGL